MTYNNYGGNQGGQNRQPGGPAEGGYLYPNDKKNTATQPDFKGKIRIGQEVVDRIMRGEREFYLSAWNKQDQKTGGNFLSVRTKGIDASSGGGQGGGGFQQRPPVQQQQAQGGPAWPQPGQQRPAAPVQQGYQQQAQQMPQNYGQGLPQQGQQHGQMNQTGRNNPPDDYGDTIPF